ncbi:cytoplasmic dynein 2 light intermediate chain 1 isoform X2 [Venturia canescens]|uniref:cytoplasmic dynein 2 light intermediate chain 1 isoform X2 n=1 Tax=Venturia canescens TaxID=32260 RepID=UPI001C9D0A97|nr:cytoplasmic dynein 2 light intermediate chain 1 isoform X2 [Venturia canescens]
MMRREEMKIINLLCNCRPRNWRELCVKDIVHVWEIGHSATSLISAAMTGSAVVHSPNHTTIFIVVDLAKPKVLLSSIDECLAITTSAMKMSYSPEDIENLKRHRTKEKKNGDENIEPFPMKLCIIGGNYDKFKEFSLDMKQHIGRSLRAISHSLAADLQYHSSKDSVLMRKTKDLLSHHGFGSHTARATCVDYGKPLIISSGNDSFASIDPAFSTMRPTSILDKVKQSYVMKFPQDSTRDEEFNLDEDPTTNPSFNETTIDRLRLQREEEISMLLRDMHEHRSSKIPIPEPY